MTAIIKYVFAKTEFRPKWYFGYLVEVNSMVEKSDAMIQYEKSAGELMKNKPKHSNHDVMHLEVRNLVAIGAGIFFVLVVAATMMGK